MTDLPRAAPVLCSIPDPCRPKPRKRANARSCRTIVPTSRQLRDGIDYARPAGLIRRIAAVTMDGDENRLLEGELLLRTKKLCWVKILEGHARPTLAAMDRISVSGVLLLHVASGVLVRSRWDQGRYELIPKSCQGNQWGGRQMPLGDWTFVKSPTRQGSNGWRGSYDVAFSISAHVLGRRVSPQLSFIHSECSRWTVLQLAICNDTTPTKDIPGTCFGFSVDSRCAGVVCGCNTTLAGRGRQAGDNYEFLCFIKAKGCVLR